MEDSEEELSHEDQKRSTIRPKDEQHLLINRINRIEGQIKGIKGMIEADAYCVDVLTQVTAARAALASLSSELLASHISGCVARDVREGNEETLKELATVLHRFMK